MPAAPTGKSAAAPCDWIIAPPHPLRGLWASRLGVSPITAQILLNRLPGPDLDTAKRFLRPSWEHLHDPELLPDMPAVADRLHRAVAGGEKIVVFGDYDVDGISGTALMWHALKLAGAEVDYYIPHRIEEGYGLNVAALREIAAGGARVVLTVDCGTSAHGPAAEARALGLDLLITDHHPPGDGPLPEAVGVVNPRRPDSRYPDNDLCGAGVAFKLAWALGKRLNNGPKVSPAYKDFLVSAAGLAGLATIADVVPLSPENRVLAAKGLPGLNASTNVGIQALLAAANLAERTPDAYDAGFVLGPRLNAAGRMGHAKLAVEMLTTASAVRAAEIAKYLNAQNDARRKQEQGILAHARAKIAKGRADPDADRCIVLADEDWNPGVVGIVAGRLVEEHHRPTILLCVKNGVAGGSGRSIEGFDLGGAIRDLAPMLISGGGHAMAAGLKVSADRLDEFTRAFRDRCRNTITDAQLRPKLRLDTEILLAALNENLVRELERLAPFGNNNPRPLLAATGAAVVGEVRVMKEAHLAFHVNQAGRGMRCVWWQAAELAPLLAEGTRLSLAFTPQINEYNGRTNVELEIRAVRFE
jgi:single-stranded-DNA-specific exonuclease